MKILVTLPLKPHQQAKLEAAAPGAQFVYRNRPEVTAQDIEDVEICIGNVPLPVLPAAKKLRWVQLNSAGTDGYTTGLPEDVLLTNATGAYGLAVSEWMLTQTIVLLKKIPLYVRNRLQNLWQSEGEIKSIWNSTTIVLGLGDIGGEYAKKMSALGSRVIGVRAHRTACPEYLEQLITLEELDSLLPTADIVANCLPSTPATQGLFDARRLALMKPGSIFVNAGRGNAVDQTALVEALKNGPLSGAALDVTDPEPLPADHALWQQENCFITPHVAGNFFLPETLERIVGIAARNLVAYAAGHPLENMVDRSTGYRNFRE